MEHPQYTCPMHTQIVEEKHGNCPICGMTLVLVETENKDADQQGSNPAMGHAEHDHNNMIADFKKQFYVVLVLSIPIMLLSEMIQHFIKPAADAVLMTVSTIVVAINASMLSLRNKK